MQTIQLALSMLSAKWLLSSADGDQLRENVFRAGKALTVHFIFCTYAALFEVVYDDSKGG